MATKGSFVLEDRRIKRYVMGENTNKRSKAITMTSGSLWKNIFLFSVPLMFSQILEIMFNLSDVAVVGQFADYKALGAVGSTTLLVTLFTSFLIGMGSGVNVQVALGLGANNKKAVEKTIHSALLICSFVGIVVAAFKAAPEEIPTRTPSLTANALPSSKASSFSIGMIS